MNVATTETNSNLENFVSDGVLQTSDEDLVDGLSGFRFSGLFTGSRSFRFNLGHEMDQRLVGILDWDQT